MSPVPVDDPIAQLIPWYANGTLEEVDRQRVESHLPDCPSCYGLLVHARSFRRLAPSRSQAELLDHVEGHLLVQYAEEPDRLDADTRRFVSMHLGACEVCAGALEILQRMSQAPIAADTAGGARAASRGLTG
ncbi:MAG TPA: zf-HC2 domain-containing protein, partial [Candidatus Polarisedimenticolia bacterium]|nr:zf-HC2 domain-containing protein [Candidatus Polarisedimenticolia bacterium]